MRPPSSYSVITGPAVSELRCFTPKKTLCSAVVAGYHGESERAREREREIDILIVIEICLTQREDACHEKNYGRGKFQTYRRNDC